MAHTGQTIVFGDMILAFDSLAALYRFGPRLIIANALDAPAGGARPARHGMRRITNDRM